MGMLLLQKAADQHGLLHSRRAEASEPAKPGARADVRPLLARPSRRGAHTPLAPGRAGQAVAMQDQLSGGRSAVNVVNG